MKLIADNIGYLDHIVGLDCDTQKCDCKINYVASFCSVGVNVHIGQRTKH
jgi:hypothetical protein